MKKNVNIAIVGLGQIGGYLFNELKNQSKDIEITAETESGIIMGIQHKNYNVHGVQFHPESIKTKHGLKILKNFVTNK